MNRQECHLLDKSWFGEGIGETWKSGDRASKEMGYDALGCSSEKQTGCDPAFNSSLWSITFSNCTK